MRLIKLLLPVIVFFSFYGKIIAQDTTRQMNKQDTTNMVNKHDTTKLMNKQDTTNLISQLEKEGVENKTLYTTATFKYTRVVDGHSVENLPAHVLDVRISHRFGPLSNGVYQFFGLDYGFFNVRVGFDYGITNNFMIGAGHNSWQKTYDAFFKIKILRQSEGAVKMPVTISFVPTVALNTLKSSDIASSNKPDPGAKTEPLSYTFQLLIGRKFSDGFSLQIMPTFIHTDNISFNHFKNGSYKRDIIAVGIGGRQKISRRMSVNAEYYYQLPGTEATTANNVVSFGIDIGTGGHVFQLHFTNSLGLTEKSFISETDKHGLNSGLRFGFNISRVFQLGKKHKGGSTEWKKG